MFDLAMGAFFFDMFLEDDNTFPLIMALVSIAGSDKRRVPKLLGFAENVVPRFNFRQHFRISPTAFEQVLATIGGFLHHEFVGGELPIPPTKQLLIFIWYISNQASMREISVLFGIAKSTTHDVIHFVNTVMCREMMESIIRWPDNARQAQIASDIERDHIFHGVVGFIDGTHIRLAFRPKKDNDYINRKGYPSIQLQIVVDHRLLITHAYVGWPGCTHDARVLRNSSLYLGAEHDLGSKFLLDHYIIGDSAYPIRPWLITPYRNNGHLTQAQRRFNKKASSIRSTVERGIGHLKGRLRRLQCIHLYSVKAICELIINACILHNICILTEDELDDFIEPEEDVNEYRNMFGNAQNGSDMRDRLVELFN